VRLLVQPGDGVGPLVKAIKKAKKSVEIVIFRFDRAEVERALVDAVERGVFVHALIAFTNRGGEKHLRNLETHFLAKGITVARTAGDLVRYHGKMMIVDRRELHVLSFNFTHLDVEHSRGFAVITRNQKLVQEAINLFEADCKRQPYSPGSSKFIVSPLNARRELMAFIKGATKQLLIYDPKVSERSFLRLLQQKCEAGLDVRIIGKATVRGIPVRALTRIRLHTRTIIRDGSAAFMGSQSLRQLELDARREIGVIFRDAKSLKVLKRQFQEDWKASEATKELPEVKALRTKTANKVAKAVAKKLPVQPVIDHLVKAIKKKAKKKANPKEIELSVKEAVKSAVGETVKEVTQEAIEEVITQSA
jgi:phosphatidylserine/phosphatidylglycerophosphate/cardiolipin synthase-like enzyme